MKSPRKSRKALVVTVLSILLGLLSYFILSRYSFASSSSGITDDSYDDFSLGSPNGATDIETLPGYVRLKRDVESYTETDFADFDDGRILDHSTIVTNNDGGEVQVNQGFSYSPISDPATLGGWGYETFYDSTRDFIYICSGNGLSVVDNQGTIDSSDDELVGVYNLTSTPALPGSSDSVGYVYIDHPRNLLYIETSGGLAVLDTKGTDVTTDDEVLAYYDDTTPIPYSNYIEQIEYDETNELLYVANWDWGGTGGLNVVDTQGDSDPTNDTLVIRYSTSSTPSISSYRVATFWVDPIASEIYIGTWNSGIYVIDTNGTPTDPSDDTLDRRYNMSTTPPIYVNYVMRFHHDDINNLLYFRNSQGGYPNYLGMIDVDTNQTYSYRTSGVYETTASSSGTLISSNPRIGSNQITTLYDPDLGYLYFAGYGEASYPAISVIDTSNNDDPSDDNLIAEYSDTTIPRLAENDFGYPAYDSDNQVLISPSGNRGYTMSISPGKYNKTSYFLSHSLPISSVPVGMISWDETVNEDQRISLQARVGTGDTMTVDNFDDGDVSNISPYGSSTFSSVSELGGSLILSDPSGSTYAAFSYDTGMPSGYFPKGSLIFVNFRVTSSATGLRLGCGEISGPTEDHYYSINLDQKIELVALSDFNELAFRIWWDSGTWNNPTDYLELYDLTIESPTDNWSEWTDPCTNPNGCDLGLDLTGQTYVQYKATFDNDDQATTPFLNSVTFSDVYRESGIYTSSVLAAEGPIDWGAFNYSADVPGGTGISFEVRNGETAVPDGSWSGWIPISEISQQNVSYFQYRAIMETLDGSSTPVLDWVSFPYVVSELVGTGTGVLWVGFIGILLFLGSRYAKKA